MAVQIFYHEYPLKRNDILYGLVNPDSVTELCQLYGITSLNQQILAIPSNYNLNKLQFNEVKNLFNDFGGKSLVFFDEEEFPKGDAVLNIGES